MTSIDDLTARNATFAANTFRDDLTINAWGDITVIGCVDPRVDPAYVLGLGHGEAAVIRNVGGRVTPSTLRTLAMLAKVRQAHAPAAAPAATRTLVVLHHTRCGMNDSACHPDLLAGYFEIAESALDTKSVTDPHGSVRVDVDVLTAALHGPDTVVVGLVYEVDTGAVEMVSTSNPTARAVITGGDCAPSAQRYAATALACGSITGAAAPSRRRRPRWSRPA